MVELQIGRHGLILLLVVFLLLGAEDVLIWINEGAVPAVEFFLATVVVLAIFVLAIVEARSFIPPK